jgi:hypothetical protein
MQLRFLPTLSVIAVTLFGACSGGGGSGAGLRAPSCSSASSTAFCLVACNLGCSSTGCGVTEIAQNQPIQLTFSRAVDPASVSAATVSLQTATGEPANGELTVNQNTITFTPQATLQGGVTLFGLRKNENYILSLPGGPGTGLSLRSSSGESLGQSVTCTLSVSRGPIDLDGAPPVPTLVSPTATSGVPEDVTIIVELSELIDAQPFVGATSANAPILYRIRRSRQPVGGQPGELECDPNASAEVLPGIPRVTVDSARNISVVTMRPSISLPSQVCVEVEITDRVRDLSGRQAVPKTFAFTTRLVNTAERTIVESFGSDAQLDRDVSSGTWGNGQALPGAIGYDGLHGSFDVSIGDARGGGEFVWDVENFTIPGGRTLSGNPERVTDGIFRFTDFVLPEGTTMVLAGTRPAQFYVRGKVDIRGRILANAPGTAVYSQTAVVGQPGGSGILGGARGGQGGDANSPTGVGGGQNPAFSGRPGEDVRLFAGHAYASRAVGTGGRGSPMNPASGLNADVTYRGLGLTTSAQISAGGGGGGFLTAGGEGRAVFNNTTPVSGLGDPGPGGAALSLFPLPAPTGGRQGLEHFLIGGSGGGGAGTHPFFSIQNQNRTWRAGHGGAGGGGAIAFRAGGDVGMTGSGRIEVHGGSGPQGIAAPPAGPGGGGSGGSVVFQCGGNAQMAGTLSLIGGLGGFTNDRVTFNLETRGGNGSAGFARLEVPQQNPGAGLIGTVVPPATQENVGTLTDTDPIVGSQSRWYSTRLVFPPEFLRYEIQATIDGNPVVFSDDPAFGIAADETQALRFLVQGARVNAANNEADPSTIRPWRTRVRGVAPSLNTDDATGFRFTLLFNRGIAQSIVVRRVTLFFRG